MNEADCITLEKVYQKPPPSIPWADMHSLFVAIANDYGVSCSHSPGSRLILVVAQQEQGNNMSPVIIRITHTPMLYTSVVARIALRLAFAGIPLCP